MSDGVDDPAAELARLVDEAAARPEERELHKRLVWLVDLLIARGQLAPGHRAMLGRIRDDGARVHLSVVSDKRSVPSAEIDCAARLHLSRARCCSFTISLSAEDVAEGRLRWELERPYVLRRDAATGYCENLSPEHGCTVYADRPATCRSYDCRQDPRVWLDFAGRVPAPLT